MDGDVDQLRPRRASSSSELKTPRPPSSEKLCRRSRSPTVESGTIATGPSPAARSASAASPAWQSARRDPRVPRRSTGYSGSSARPNRSSAVSAYCTPSGPVALSRAAGWSDCAGACRRAARQPLEALALGGVESGRQALDLGGAQRLGARPQRTDRRNDGALGLPGAELLRGVGADRLGGRGLVAAQCHRARDLGREIVEAVHATALELRNLRLDVRRERRGRATRAGRAARDSGRDHVGAQHRVRCRGRADDDVDGSQLLGDVLEVHRRSTEPTGEDTGALVGAVRDRQPAQSARHQVERRQLGRASGADDERGAARETAERHVSARLAATEATDAFPAEIAGLAARALAASRAPAGTRARAPGPPRPPSRRPRGAERTCPSTCASPGTSESRPAATRFRCSDAVASVRR